MARVPLARRPGFDAISIASAVAALPARPTLHANGTCDSAIDVSSPHLGIKGHMPPWNRLGRQFSAFSQTGPLPAICWRLGTQSQMSPKSCQAHACQGQDSGRSFGFIKE